MSTPPPPPPPPLAVIAVNVVLGVLSLLAATTSLATGVPVPEPTGLGFLQPLAPVFPAVEIVLGTFFLVISYGLWCGHRWAWIANVAFECVHIVADIGFLASRAFSLDKIIGLVVILGVLAYLTRPRVRAWYARPAAPADARR